MSTNSVNKRNSQANITAAKQLINQYSTMFSIAAVLKLFILFNFSYVIGQKLKNHFVADPNGDYNVYYEENNGNFTVEVQVKSSGYVGFGFSPDGKMPGADVIIGWVYPNGTSVFHDRHALGFYEPLIDTKQNYELLYAQGNDTHTILRFTRKLNTCDQPNDNIITDDTTRVIYSWHPDDPPAITGLPYHGPDRRGAKRIYPLSSPLKQEEITSDITIWNVQMPNIALQPKLTTYWCITVKIPNFTEPHEFVGFKMNITPGNEMIVHHFLLFECVGNSTYFEEKVANVAGFECVTAGTVVPPMECQPPIAAWAIGSDGYTLPENVGVPVGEEYGGATYFLMQMHYNNAGEKAGIVDNTAVEIYLTNKPRPIKGSNLQIYSNIDYTMVLPPNQPAYRVAAFCPSQCTAKAIPKEGITLYATGLHAHLAGRKISIRHFRDNKELPPISVDNQFDFNYQDMRGLSKPITVLQGDILMATCEYSTLDRNKTTLGGYSTIEEMCFVYMFYYPAIPLSICIGGPPYKDIFAYFGVEGVGPDQYHITGPPNLAGQSMFTYLQNYDWKSVSAEKFQQMTYMQYEGEMDFTCVSGHANKAGDLQQVKVMYPANATMYVPNDTICEKTTTTKKSSEYY